MKEETIRRLKEKNELSKEACRQAMDFAAGWNARREPFPRPARRLTKTHTNQRVARVERINQVEPVAGVRYGIAA